MEVARQELVKLMETREKMEKRMEELMQALNESGFGLSGGLVDEDGFPISDVPKIIEVRLARKELAELRTDYTLLQRDIEKGVFTVFARAEGDEPPEPPSFTTEREITVPSPGVELSSLAQASATPQPSQAPLSPFAKIGSVMPGSPAAKGGVCVGDLLLQFGYVTSGNHNQLTALRDVVIANLDHDVGVRVLRGRKTVELSVRPGKWAGKGVLGCHFLPHEQSK